MNLELVGGIVLVRDCENESARRTGRDALELRGSFLL